MTENKFDRQSVMKGFLWRFAERTGAQGVTLVVSIVLARILDPSVYGIIAIVTVFTSVLQVFVDSGFGNALIQKKDADDLDFSSVFWFNIAICTILYCGMFFFSPIIASFYSMPDLVPVIRVLSITLIISGVKNVQQAYVSKNMMFKRFFYATIGGTVGAAIIGVLLAIKGYGVWALVVQNIFNQTVDTIILWLTVKWHPSFKISIKRLKVLASFGWKLLMSTLIDTIYNELRSLIIGKMYTESDLAFYKKGSSFPSLLVENINSSISSVLFPSLSSVQDNELQVKNMTRRAMKTSIYVLAPMMIGLCFCAESVVNIILTEKWLPCVIYMRIFCISYMFYPLHTANLNAIKAMGRSDLFLKLEILKKIVGFIILLISMWYGVEAMAYSLLIVGLISQVINSWPNKKLLDYSYFEQIRDILPNITAALIMGGIINTINYLNINNLLKLIIQIPLGMLLYYLISRLLKLDSYIYLTDMLKDILNKHKDKNHT